MIVNKTIWLNPVEPHPLSFRAPVGLETSLNIAFLRQNGSPYNSDIGAQLQLTGRTTERTTTFLMPATDIANGKARATIPADTLTDPNGYRLRMIGTLSGGSALLAVGSVMPMASAGFDAIPVDVIDTVPLTFEYNEAVELDVQLWQDVGKGQPYDLSASVVTANIYDSKGGQMIMPFTTSVVLPSTVHLTLTPEQVNQLPAIAWWNLVVSTSAGATTLAEGQVTITGTVIPPLTTATFNYAYLTPSTDDDPANGQVVHSDITQNTLLVAFVDSDAVDRRATLELVAPGDEIVIGATTWTVNLVRTGASWFEFAVTPVAQDAATGTVPVTFRRP